MYRTWSALDMALILELALQKEGDIRENVLSTLNSLAEKQYRPEDASLPDAIRWLIGHADPVEATRRVVNNYYRITQEMLNDKFKAEPEPDRLEVVATRELPPGKLLEAGAEVLPSPEELVDTIRAKAQQTLIDTSYEDAVRSQRI